MEKYLLYLSKNDVAAAGVKIKEIIDILGSAMAERGRGKAPMPPKTNLYLQGNKSYVNAMPAYIPALRAAGLKWVSAFPDNPQKGLPYVNGLIILNDPGTGMPLAIMDAVWITTYRTGAATALSARFLARKNAKTLGILGCGVQGDANARALASEFQLTTIFAYDPQPGKSRAFAKATQEALGIETISVDTPKAAVKDCDIVVTCGPITKPPHATIQPGWLAPGAFASLVDYDAYWHAGALREIHRFCTDDTPQFLRYKELGYFPEGPPIHADLGQLAAGLKPGRTSAREKTGAANLGSAVFDMATAALVYERAKEKGLGQQLPL